MIAVLAGSLAVQFLLPGDDVMPPAAPMHPDTTREVSLAQPVPVRAVVPARMFEPATHAQAGGAGEGIAVLGAIQRGPRIVAVVEGRDGRIGHVRPGGAIADWRLLQVKQDAVMLVRGSERLRVPFGTRVPLQMTKADRGTQ